MNHDSSVINLKDLRKKTDAGTSAHFDVPASATVVLRPASASAPAFVPPPQPTPKIETPVASVSTPPVPAALVRQQETPAKRSFVPPAPKASMTKAKIATYAIGGLVLAGILAVGGHYIYVHVWTVSPFEPSPGTPEATTSAESAAAAAATETKTSNATSTLSQAEIVSRVQKLMLVPQGEDPVLAAVSDPSALSDQAFFKNAKIGDIVLMYAKARRAILYDPANDKVIEVAPITDTPVK